ncbi:hypothetical protein, partial [Streptomyces sp. NPDC054838]
PTRADEPARVDVVRAGSPKAFARRAWASWSTGYCLDVSSRFGSARRPAQLRPRLVAETSLIEILDAGSAGKFVDVVGDTPQHGRQGRKIDHHRVPVREVSLRPQVHHRGEALPLPTNRGPPIVINRDIHWCFSQRPGLVSLCRRSVSGVLRGQLGCHAG